MLIDRDFGTLRITVFTGLNQSLGFAQSGSIDQNDVLLVGGRIEEVARVSSLTCHDFSHSISRSY